MSGVEKKESFIEYSGVTTNNLKNLDVKIKKNTMISIAGPSGAGKTSLAYTTIFNISKFEEAKLKNEDIPEKQFHIKKYKNIISAVDLKQVNLNNNPRSTIATFLNLDTEFKKIFGKTNRVSPTIFTFNMPNSACESCNGLGYVHTLDESKIVDENKSIKDGAFVPWRKSTQNYEEKLLIKFAEDNLIPIDKKISQLTEKQRNLLLFCEKSEKKYRVSYKVYGKQRNKEFYYVGIMTEKESDLKKINKASSLQKVKACGEEKICPVCNGQRFNKNVLSYKYFDKSIGDLYNMEIDMLYDFLLKLPQKESCAEEISVILPLLKEIIESNLGYLNLNRSIPTLSGGELQRVRLVSILSSQISNMLYVVDEPSSKLHVTEYKNLYESLEKIKKRDNTLILVEHNPYFLEKSDSVIYIGPKAGIAGGKIIEKKEFITKEVIDIKKEDKKETFKELMKIENITKNNLNNISVTFPKNSIVGIYGVSGSGKSTLCKEISKKIKNSEYIDQKPIKGSIISTIGTYSGTLFQDIREEISKKLKIDNPNVFNFNSTEGKCKACNGKGKIKFLYDYGKDMEVICTSCRGKRYSKVVLKSKKYEYKGKDIYKILNMTIDELIEKKMFDTKKINEKLDLLKQLGLGHLSLFRTTDTLSGGESQRVKLSDSLGKKIKDKVLFFDEPLSGLSIKDSMNILKIFRKLVEKGATVVFIEHNILGIKASDYIIEVGPGKGKNGGKIIFQDYIEEFLKSENYKKYSFMEKYFYKYD